MCSIFFCQKLVRITLNVSRRLISMGIFVIIKKEEIGEREQYNDIKKIIKSMSLVPTNWDQEYAYIMWTRDDDTSETVYVDGAEEFDMIKEMYFE